MNIQDSNCGNKTTVLFNNQNVLGCTIDRLFAVMSKLTTQSDNQGRHFKPNIYPGKGEDKEGLIIMMEVGSKADISQAVNTDFEITLKR